jgi:hypothetical protein
MKLLGHLKDYQFKPLRSSQLVTHSWHPEFCTWVIHRGVSCGQPRGLEYRVRRKDDQERRLSNDVRNLPSVSVLPLQYSAPCLNQYCYSMSKQKKKKFVCMNYQNSIHRCQISDRHWLSLLESISGYRRTQPKEKKLNLARSKPHTDMQHLEFELRLKRVRIFQRSNY